MSTKTLVAQAQTKEAVNGRWWYGYSLFEDEEGFFSVVVHTRTYDGVRVESEHGSGPLGLAASTKEEATQMAAEIISDLIRVCHPVSIEEMTRVVEGKY